MTRLDAAPAAMKLSVVIPCYNEAATIERLLETVRAAPWPEMEIIVVDDCSTDGSRELLQGRLRRPVDHLVVHEREPAARAPRCAAASARPPAAS